MNLTIHINYYSLNYMLVLYNICQNVKVNIVTPKAYEGGEWSSVHKEQKWTAPDNFLATEFISELEGSWGHVGTRLHGWRMTYKNCLILPTPTRCIYFLVAQTIRTSQLSVLDLEQFRDGWPQGFPEKSELRQNTLKKLVLVCGVTRQFWKSPETFQVVS